MRLPGFGLPLPGTRTGHPESTPFCPVDQPVPPLPAAKRKLGLVSMSSSYVPNAVTRPSESSTIRSQCRTVPRRWATITTIANPSAALMASMTLLSVATSRALVASSYTSTLAVR